MGVNPAVEKKSLEKDQKQNTASFPGRVWFSQGPSQWEKGTFQCLCPDPKLVKRVSNDLLLFQIVLWVDCMLGIAKL